VDAYIEERLGFAGYSGKGIFKRSARRAIFEVTGGLPRLINIVCDGALLAGYAREQTSLGADVIREVARDLQLPDASEGDAAKLRGENGVPKQKRGGWFGLFG
jgi:general secretion pathway protein A